MEYLGRNMKNTLKESLLSIGFNSEQIRKICSILTKIHFKPIIIESAVDTVYLTFGQKFSRAAVLEMQVLSKESYLIKVWVFINKTHAWFGEEFYNPEFDNNFQKKALLFYAACDHIQNHELTTADLWRVLDHGNR